MLEITYESIRGPQIRVCVDLNQPQPKVLINQKIVAEEFEHIFPPVRIELGLHTQERVNNQIFHPWNEMLTDAQF